MSSLLHFYVDLLHSLIIRLIISSISPNVLFCFAAYFFLKRVPFLPLSKFSRVRCRLFTVRNVHIIPFFPFFFSSYSSIDPCVICVISGCFNLFSFALIFYSLINVSTLSSVPRFHFLLLFSRHTACLCQLWESSSVSYKGNNPGINHVDEVSVISLSFEYLPSFSRDNLFLLLFDLIRFQYCQVFLIILFFPSVLIFSWFGCYLYYYYSLRFFLTSLNCCFLTEIRVTEVYSGLQDCSQYPGRLHPYYSLNNFWTSFDFLRLQPHYQVFEERSKRTNHRHFHVPCFFLVLRK